MEEVLLLQNNHNFDFLAGEVLLIAKPLDWTSFDVVKKVKKLFNVPKIGHAGTLDPRATGLLVLCTGKKTKEIETFKDFDKEYLGEMELGAVTPSYDSETDVSERKPIDHITVEVIKKVFSDFIGEQEQMPPMYSAIKYGGKPLYYYARKGKKVVRATRRIEITECEPTSIQMPCVRFRIVCSKGTYIRTLVHDIGERLGCGAYLRSLERTRVGPFLLSDAWSLNELMTRAHELPRTVA